MVNPVAKPGVVNPVKPGVVNPVAKPGVVNPAKLVLFLMAKSSKEVFGSPRPIPALPYPNLPWPNPIAVS